ncbi:porin family protein [Cellvibrio sp. KY-GH-1]|uniref:outer membrane beta-barrel protein n=1 Tax=Cellvibrio sp. KY-GH-1 TaxID=2303332 RepID=UPI001245DF56|nr:outer membrane beta-barrel protein [Cellvibrio sp. KY-GH-1]QEY16862.1 porin family protein [Cellvibrio sp. KY-GH-1]
MKNWLFALLIGVPAVAVAGDNMTGGFYLGGGIAQADFRYKDKPEGAKDSKIEVWYAEELLAGFKVNPFVGVEGRIGGGAGDSDLVYASLYYRTESSNDTAKTYLLFGYTAGQNMDDDEDANIYGPSYGAGVGFPVTPSLNFNLEYRMILDGRAKVDDNSTRVRMGGFTVNVDYRF